MKLLRPPIKYVLCFFFLGCTAKKKLIEYRIKKQTDTIRLVHEKIVTKPINDTLFIEKPCDSLGNLKRFEKEFSTPLAKVKITTTPKGDIKATINIDSLVNCRLREISSRTSEQKEVKEKTVVRYRYPYWIWISLGVNVLLLIYGLKRLLSPL